MTNVDQIDELLERMSRVSKFLELFMSRCDEKTLELMRQCGREVSGAQQPFSSIRNNL
jgi:hypothetical protein